MVLEWARPTDEIVKRGGRVEIDVVILQEDDTMERPVWILQDIVGELWEKQVDDAVRLEFVKSENVLGGMVVS